MGKQKAAAVAPSVTEELAVNALNKLDVQALRTADAIRMNDGHLICEKYIGADEGDPFSSGYSSRQRTIEFTSKDGAGKDSIVFIEQGPAWVTATKAMRPGTLVFVHYSQTNKGDAGVRFVVLQLVTKKGRSVSFNVAVVTE